MFRGFLYHGDSDKLESLDHEALAKCKLPSDESDAPPLCQTHSFLWIDVAAPTPEQLDAIGKRFKLNPQILEDLHQEEGRPKLHDYEKYIYLIFHSMTLEAGALGQEGSEGEERIRNGINTVEIDCLLGPDWILTIHPEPIQAFDTLADRWERRPGWMHNGPAHLLYELMDAVLDGYFPILEQLDEHIDSFEDRLYSPETANQSGQPISGEIFVLKRTLLKMRHIAGPTRDVVNVLLRRDGEEGGRHFAAFQDLYDHASRIVENIDTYREILSGALDAYLAVESNRMNAVMKRLTAFSIILLLPTLIAGIYGMNFDDMPKHHGFWESISAMGTIVVLLLAYFKRLNWL